MALTIFELIELVFSAFVFCIIVLIILRSVARTLLTVPSASGNNMGYASVELEHQTSIGIELTFLAIIVVVVAVLAIISTQSSGRINDIIFASFYLLVPLLSSIYLFCHKGVNDLAMGIFALVKSIFYFFLVVVSMLQYVYLENADLGKLALGFTLSIAVLESVMSFLDGDERISLEKYKRDEQKIGRIG